MPILKCLGVFTTPQLLQTIADMLVLVCYFEMVSHPLFKVWPNDPGQPKTRVKEVLFFQNQLSVQTNSCFIIFLRTPG